LVLDPAFGDRLADLPSNEPVWIIKSADNEVLAREYWKHHPSRNHLTGLTLFDSCNGDPEAEFIGVLGTVNLHHGEHSASPPYSILEVIGCAPSDSIRAALADIGFAVVSSSAAGFTAHRDLRVA
jgi:hypothetical protein